MKLISVIAEFKHGHDTFYVGEKRYVSDEDATYFCKHGWATADSVVTGTPDTSAKTLNVQDSKLGHKESK